MVVRGYREASDVQTISNLQALSWGYCGFIVCVNICTLKACYIIGLQIIESGGQELVVGEIVHP